MKSNTDGEEKPNVISAMFDKGLNVSFFNDLLSKYMRKVQSIFDVVLSKNGTEEIQ